MPKKYWLMRKKTRQYLRDSTFLEAFSELSNEDAIAIREAYNNKDAPAVAKLIDKAQWHGFTLNRYCIMCMSVAMQIADAVIHFRENPQDYGY